MRISEFFAAVTVSVALVMWILWAILKADRWCVPLDEHTQRCVVMETRPR